MSKNIKIDYNLPAATLTARNPTIAYLHQGRESDTGRTKTGTAVVTNWNSLPYDDAGSAATTTEVDMITENAPADGDTLKELADRLTALEGAPGGTPVKIYRANITQAGTDAPIVIDLLENSVGAVVWTYVQLGAFRLTLTGAFLAGKVFSPNIIHRNDDDTAGMLTANRMDNNQLEVLSFDFALNAIEPSGICPFELFIYP